MKTKTKKTTPGSQLSPEQILLFSGLFIFLFIGVLITFKPAFDYTIIKNIAGYGFCLIASLSFFMQKKRLQMSAPVFYCFLCLAAWFLTACFYAPYKYAAAHSLEKFLLYFLIFTIAANISITRLWIYFWICAAFIAEIYGIKQGLGPTHYPVSTFGNPNFFGGHILMPAMLGVGLLTASIRLKKQYAETIMLSIFLILSIFVLFCLPAKSRAVMYGCLIGFACFPVFAISSKNKRSLFVKWCPLAFVTIFTASLYPKIEAFFKSNIRYYIWNGTRHLIFWKDPEGIVSWTGLLKVLPTKVFTGYGLGNFMHFYPYVRIREYFLQEESTPITNHPHCEYLEIWSETGLIGLLLFAALIALIIWYARKKNTEKPLQQYREKSSGQDSVFQKMVTAGMISGIIAVLVDNILSTNLRNPSTAMYFWFLLGIVAGTHRKKISFRFSRFLWISIALTGFVMAFFTWHYRIVPEVHLKKGIWAKDSKQYSAAEAHYLTTCERNPFHVVAWYKLAYVYGQLQQYEKARRVYLHVHRDLFPHFAKIDANLGTIYIQQKKMKQAMLYYQWSEWFNPYDKDMLCSIASLYLIEYKNKPEAKVYLQRVLQLDAKNKYANRIMKLLKKEEKGNINVGE